jgi:hypothetical protein
MIRWLDARAWFSAEEPRLLFDLVPAWLVERKNLLSGMTVPARVIDQTYDCAAARPFNDQAQRTGHGHRAMRGKPARHVAGPLER